MAVRLFVDTWGWLTLHDKGDRYHQLIERREKMGKRYYISI
ncbi:hypothetical protein [Gloeocapsopsis sp. IPPAS B-1203]|nr:hypothetical protein [Gloeocapsopsis sp. IPPAS B-1203]